MGAGLAHANDTVKDVPNDGMVKFSTFDSSRGVSGDVDLDDTGSMQSRRPDRAPGTDPRTTGHG